MREARRTRKEEREGHDTSERRQTARELPLAYSESSTHLSTPESTAALPRNDGSDTMSATASLMSPELMFPVGRPDKPRPTPASTTLLATSCSHEHQNGTRRARGGGISTWVLCSLKVHSTSCCSKNEDVSCCHDNHAVCRSFDGSARTLRTQVRARLYTQRLPSSM